ncbi:MAG TPA: terminase small subunit [Opitutaceae bacterium]|nr:terminase small subunit [Opitutaceae bacterium]
MEETTTSTPEQQSDRHSGVLQLSLPEIERAFAATGIKTLPDGVSDLNRREMVFVARLLEHGQHARAAIEAGYSETSAGPIASELLRKPKVFAFYRRCLDKVASDAAVVVRSTFERYVILNAKFLEAAQQVKDADAFLVSGFQSTNGKAAKDRTDYEQARARAQRDEKHYSTLARGEGMLLAALLGKLKVQIAGDVHVSVISDEDRAHLMSLEAQGVPVRMPALAGGRN